MDVNEFRNTIVRQGVEGALIMLAEKVAELEAQLPEPSRQQQTFGEKKDEDKPQPEPSPFGEPPQRDPAAPRQEEHRNG